MKLKSSLGGPVVLVLLLTALARAQNTTITLYDQQNGTGNVIMIYTGPMLNPGLNGALVNGFVLNPGAMHWTTQPISADDQAGSLSPCSAFTPTAVLNEAVITCESAAVGTSNGVPLFSFCFQGVQWPIPAGTYNVDSANQSYCGNYFYAYSQTPGYASYDFLNSASIVVGQAAPTYSCQGFHTPFDIPILIKTKVQRAIPLKAQMFDGGGTPITPTVLGTVPAPVVNVTYTANGGTAADVTSELDPLGQSSSGNVFNFDSTTNTWWFNLATTPFSAWGTYTVSLQSGDSSKYLVSPQCSGTFVRQ